MTTFYGDLVSEIPSHPGPTHDRFLSVRLDEAINFGGRVEREINTMREGFGEFVLRARTVFGEPMLAVGFRGDVRLVAWAKVIQAQPHPDMTYPEGPVNYPDEQEAPAPFDDLSTCQQVYKPAKRRGRPPKVRT